MPHGSGSRGGGHHGGGGGGGFHHHRHHHHYGGRRHYGSYSNTIFIGRGGGCTARWYSMQTCSVRASTSLLLKQHCMTSTGRVGLASPDPTAASCFRHRRGGRVWIRETTAESHNLCARVAPNLTIQVCRLVRWTRGKIRVLSTLYLAKAIGTFPSQFLC